MVFPRISDTTGVHEETPPATPEQEVTQNPEAETPDQGAPATEEPPKPEATETEEGSGGAELETPEAAEPQEQDPLQPEVPASDDYRKEIETRLFKESNGQIKTIDDFIAYNKKLAEMYQEAVNQKPVINSETIQEVNKRLIEEKGYSLAEALRWQETDVKSLPESEKLFMAMKAEAEVGHTDDWYRQKLRKFEVLQKSQDEIKELIEDGEISAREIEELRVERDDMLYRSEKILEKYKQSFDINVNFDPKPSAEADKQRQLAEEQTAAEVRAAISESLKSLDKVEFEVNLPSELGSHKIAIPVSDADKHELLATENRHFLNDWYRTPDGKFDFQMMQKHLYQGRNTEKIVQQAVIQAVAEAEKRRIARKDNVHTEKERRAAEAKGETPYGYAASRMAERFGR